MKPLKKSKRKKSSPVIGSYLTAKECPKCGAKLYHEISGGLTRYICGKCGYFGPVALNPSDGKNIDKKNFNQAVKDMKSFLKSKEK